MPVFLSIVACVLAGFLMIVSIYMLAVVLGAWLYRAPRKGGSGSLRIAIIVPAHNEGAGITHTLTQLQNCRYPEELRQAYVIADNCTDNTAAVARACGSRVVERHDLAARGKGPALNWFLREQKDELSAYGVLAFIDADMNVDGEFLQALDDAFRSPETLVVQTRNTVANPEDGWLAAAGFTSFAYVNHVRPAGRCYWGGSAGLKGSGMAFRSNLILETGWPSGSIAEDLDFTKALTLRRIRIVYQPRAMVTSDIASRLRQVSVQQERWEGGKLQVFASSFRSFLGAFLRRPSFLLLDECLDLLVPPLSLLVVFTAATAALGWVTGTGFAEFTAVFTALVFGAAVVTGLVQLRLPARAWRHLLMAPLFMALKIVLFAKLAFTRRQTEWKRTPRDHEN